MVEHQQKSFEARDWAHSHWCCWICWMSQWIFDTEYLWTGFRVVHVNMPWRYQSRNEYPHLWAVVRLRNYLLRMNIEFIKKSKFTGGSNLWIFSGEEKLTCFEGLFQTCQIWCRSTHSIDTNFKHTASFNLSNTCSDDEWNVSFFTSVGK